MKLHWKFWQRNKAAAVTEPEVDTSNESAMNQKRLAELLCRSVHDVLGLQRVIGNSSLIRLLMLEKQLPATERNAAGKS